MNILPPLPVKRFFYYEVNRITIPKHRSTEDTPAVIAERGPRIRTSR